MVDHLFLDIIIYIVKIVWTATKMIVTTMMWLTIIQRREESRDSVASVIRVMKTQK